MPWPENRCARSCSLPSFHFSKGADPHLMLPITSCSSVLLGGQTPPTPVFPPFQSRAARPSKGSYFPCSPTLHLAPVHRNGRPSAAPGLETSCPRCPPLCHRHTLFYHPAFQGSLCTSLIALSTNMMPAGRVWDWEGVLQDQPRSE